MTALYWRPQRVGELLHALPPVEPVEDVDGVAADDELVCSCGRAWTEEAATNAARTNVDNESMMMSFFFRGMGGWDAKEGFLLLWFVRIGRDFDVGLLVISATLDNEDDDATRNVE